MTPEALHIKETNGCTWSNKTNKQKVDNIKQLMSFSSNKNQPLMLWMKNANLVFSGCCSPHWMCNALSSCRLCVCECVCVALRGCMFFLVLREQQVPVMPSSLERDGLRDGKFCSAVCRYPCS